MLRVTERDDEFIPAAAVFFLDEQIEILRLPRVAISDDRVPADEQKRQLGGGGALAEIGEECHIPRLSTGHSFANHISREREFFPCEAPRCAAEPCEVKSRVSLGWRGKSGAAFAFVAQAVLPIRAGLR